MASQMVGPPYNTVIIWKDMCNPCVLYSYARGKNLWSERDVMESLITNLMQNHYMHVTDLKEIIERVCSQKS